MKTKQKSKIIISLAVILLLFIITAMVLKNVHDDYVENSYPLKYQQDVFQACEKYGVEPALVYGVMKTESSFDPEAVSHAGAIGLMQITPETFDWIQTYYAEENDYTAEDLKDYHVNIDYGTHILSILIEMYQNEDNAICAYNAGVGNVNSWLEDERYSSDGSTLSEIPIAETKNYLKLVKQNKSIYNRLYFYEAD